MNTRSVVSVWPATSGCPHARCNVWRFEPGAVRPRWSMPPSGGGVQFGSLDTSGQSSRRSDHRSHRRELVAIDAPNNHLEMALRPRATVTDVTTVEPNGGQLVRCFLNRDSDLPYTPSFRTLSRASDALTRSAIGGFYPTRGYGRSLVSRFCYANFRHSDGRMVRSSEPLSFILRSQSGDNAQQRP